MRSRIEQWARRARAGACACSVLVFSALQFSAVTFTSIALTGAALGFTPGAHAQQCVPYIATVSSGFFGIGGNSAAEACQAIVAAIPHPKLANGGAVSIDVSYVGVQQVLPTHAYCLLHNTATRTSDGASLPGESGDFVLDGVAGPVCTPQHDAIALSGPGATKAMPAGPVLLEVASVTRNGAPAAGRTVNITIDGVFYTSGVTGAAGQFAFNYVPPRVGGVTAHVVASCDSCAAAASKDIAVAPCDICLKLGNPIQPATGEKFQIEADWTDGSPHPLNVVRTYRSQGRFAAGMGATWTHNWAASAQLAAGPLVILPDGSSVLMQPTTDAGHWVASNGDTLQQSEGGLLYLRAADDSRWDFNAAGKPVRITQRNGWSVQLGYDAAQRLAHVTNAFGRSLLFAYDLAGRIASITTPDGAQITYGYDAGSRLTVAAYPGGVTRRYFYDDARWPNALTSIENEAGNRYAGFSYDAQGRVTVTEHVGGADRFTVRYIDDDGAGVGGGGSGGTGGGRDTPTRPGSGNPGSGSIDGGQPVGALALTAQVIDPLGSLRTYTFQGGDGRAQRTAAGPHDGNQIATRTLNAANLPEIDTDFNGVQTVHAWDTQRQLPTATTQAAGRAQARTTSMQWHPVHRLPVVIAEPGRSTYLAYDGAGNQISETIVDEASAERRTRSWTYSARGLADSYTDWLGKRWRYEHDASGNRTGIIDPLGQRTTFTHDNAGRVLTQSSPGRPDTHYTYDARGRLLTEATGALRTAYAYTPYGALASALMPGGLRIDYSYDRAQRLVALQDNRGAVIRYTLDAAGNRLREEVSDAHGNIALVTARSIDAFNRVASIAGDRVAATALRHDGNGALIGQTTPLGQETTLTLDELGRPTGTRLADGQTIQQAWNPLDQRTQVLDPKGVATAYTTNAFGEVMRETSPDTGTIRYTRDAAGRVRTIEDARANLTRIERDALGRPTRVEYSAASGLASGLVADIASGIASGIASAPDRVSTFDYDAAGELIAIEDSSGSTHYSRDALGRITRKTQRVHDNPGNPGSYTVDYAYAPDSLDSLESVKYPSGLAVIYTRQAGRVTGVHVQEPRQAGRTPAPTPTPFISNLTHTPLGEPRSWSWSNGDTALRRLDSDGRLTHTEIASYSHDAASRITGVTQLLWASSAPDKRKALVQQPITWTAGYDARDRLTSFGRNGAQSSFTYDANSNRLTAIDTQGSDVDLEGAFDAPNLAPHPATNLAQTLSQTLSVEATSNRLLGLKHTLTSTQNGKTLASATATVTYGVDANGSMTSDGLRRFDYDASGRLSKVRVMHNGEEAAVHYLHNALGQRVFKTEPQAEQTLAHKEVLGKGFIAWLKANFGWLFSKQQQTLLGTAFVHGDGPLPTWALLAERDNGTATARTNAEYIWLPTEDGSAMLIGLYKDGKFYAVHTDHLGTPRLVTDPDNQPVWQWPYSAFGNNKPTGVVTLNKGAHGQPTIKATEPAITLNLRFPGQYADAESGLHQNGWREYSARTGRYVQFDPIGLRGSWNGYTYAENTPLTKTDALGLQAVAPTPAGPVPLPIATPLPNMSPRPMDPSEPGGPTYAPGVKFPDLVMPPSVSVPLAILNWMCSQGNDFWNGLRPHRGKTKTNGESGRGRRYFEWDYTHEDVEVYDGRGNHLGSANPANGEMTKPPVPGRKINL